MNLSKATPRKRRTPRDPLDRQIGQRIRAFRMAQKITQAELGRRIGVSFQQVQKYESGSNCIRGSRIKMLAAALDVSMAALFGASDQPGEKGFDAVLLEMMSRRYSARLLDAFFAIPTRREQRAALAMLEAMASSGKRGARRRRTAKRGA